MSIPKFNLKPVVAAIMVFSVLNVPVRAQDSAQTLLEHLKSAGPEESAQISQQIERDWQRSGSRSMDLLLDRGRRALEAGNVKTAIEHLSALTDHAPQFAAGWHFRAQAFFAGGLIGPAVDDLQTALVLNPDNYNAIYGLGLVFVEIGDEDLAERAFREVLALHPHHSAAKTALEALKQNGAGRTL